jgi:signal transduction histidine kinase
MGNWTWDIPHARVLGSEEYFRIFGQPPDTGSWPIEAVIAQVHREDRQVLAMLLERSKHDPSPFTFSFRIVRPDGQVRFLQAQGYTKTYDGDRPIQFFGTVQDVTEAQEIERAKDEFLSVASHELRTPLTSIRAPLLMLAAGKIDPQTPLGRNLLELAVANTERMTRLVNDIMDMERLARGRLSLKPEPVDGRMLAMEAAAGLEADAQEAGVTIAIEGPAAPLSADPQRIVQVLTNLLDNAIDFSPREGRVRVTIAVTDHHVRFGVHDQGPGIPAGQLEAIFNRFKQVEPSATRKKQGLGLGLPISRAIAEQHGGKLWAESEPGKGATFWLELPVSRPA